MIQEIANTAALKRARRLEYLTVSWNCLEGVIAVSAGLVAGSIALVGFGFDSAIEVSSGLVLLWRLNYKGSPAAEERVEARALKLVGISLMVLAAYVLYDSLKSLFLWELPETSYVGISLAILSLIVMPLLARAKRRVASQIRSRALQADSYQTDICAYLSGILLVGLVLNAALGWWWADPVAAVAMTPIIVKEGREAFKGETCCEDHCSG
jgi:divalent metal cation (Fe/Co/Zn/Cd) transporter